jgi:deoxyribodipyrimidine photo-lyase
MGNKPEIAVFWFRRDLRLDDNHGLYQLLKRGVPVLPIFIFDKNILDRLDKPHDLRVQFIHQTLGEINLKLLELESGLMNFYSTPEQVFTDLLKEYNVKEVVANHDYEPYAVERDEKIKSILDLAGVAFNTYKDHVIFEKTEVTKDDGLPYTVFTPYSKKWKLRLLNEPIKQFDSSSMFDGFYKFNTQGIIPLESMGFTSSQFHFPEKNFPELIVKQYSDKRDFPAIKGTSKLGLHLRFGTISIRALAQFALSRSETYLNELIWRDFYHMILWNFPHVGKGKSFKKEYDLIQWRNNEQEFDKWCKGQTGYPIVDAGMRELFQTGFMHNRVRMIVASFLTKHLLIDWRWGEAWFAKHLLDFDLAANNGGWQWAAGSGCDAAPYFRVFNPALQTEKFDKKAEYIRKWVPEFDTMEYPQPIVVHEFARKRCLDNYAKFLKKNN